MDEHVDQPPARILSAVTDEELDRLPLHDQYADIDEMVYAQGKVTIPCFIDDGVPPVVTQQRRDGSPKQMEVPLRAARLTITAVAAPRLIDDQGIGLYMVNELRFSGAVVRLEMCEALIVELPVDRCDVSLTISDEVAAKVTRRRNWISESEFGFRRTTT